MRDLFKKDITIKIGSVLIAILIWLFVYNNSANPYVTNTIRNIPLTIQNESYPLDNGFIIKNKYRSTIDVVVRGRQEAVNRLTASDFEAILDFSQIKSLSDTSLKIDGPFCSEKDIEIDSVQPSTIDVQLARNKTGNFPVELVTNITMKPGYKLLDTSVKPQSITIMNEESLIDSVDSIKATLELKDLDRSLVQKVDCKVYSQDGREISGLSKNLSVEVSVDVAKEVPVTIVTKGKLAQDYVETSRLVTPETVLITGTPDQLAHINDIKTETMDISKMNKSISAAPGLALPAGIKLAEGQKDVNVNIVVEKLAVKDISVSKNDVQLLNTVDDNSLSYEITTESASLQLKGRTAVLNGISLENMLPSLDVTGLTEGTYKLPLNIVLPDEVKQMQDVFFDVKIQKVEPPPVVE